MDPIDVDRTGDRHRGQVDGIFWPGEECFEYGEVIAREYWQPSDGILVGDTPVDVETGRNAGVHTVAVLGGFRTRKELEASQPDRIVEDLHELIRLYK